MSQPEPKYTIPERTLMQLGGFKSREHLLWWLLNMGLTDVGGLDYQAMREHQHEWQPGAIHPEPPRVTAAGWLCINPAAPLHLSIWEHQTDGERLAYPAYIERMKEKDRG